MAHLIYLDIDASLKRFCVDFGEAITPNLNYEDFDSHADESTVQQGDLIGTSGLSITNNAPFLDVDVMIGISTDTDTNLLRLRKVVAMLFQRLQPLNTIDVLDYETGIKKGNLMVLEGIRILPVGGSQARPIQYVMVGFRTDCFAKS